jgi:hypothetical protein
VEFAQQALIRPSSALVVHWGAALCRHPIAGIFWLGSLTDRRNQQMKDFRTQSGPTTAAWNKFVFGLGHI